MALLSRTDILAQSDLPTEEVKVHEWGGVVRVRGMNGAERDKFELYMARHAKKLQNVRARLVSQCVVDESGSRLFGEADIAELGKLSGAALDRVYEVAARLSGIRSGDPEAALKNFMSDQSEDSISG